MPPPNYSVVIPVYRSQDTLVELAQRLATMFQSQNQSFELIFVDDCGGDNSWQVLQTLLADYPLILVRLSKNSGQHNATLCGMAHSQGQFLLTIDDDLQCPPEEVPKLIQSLEQTQAELVYGVYGQNKKHHAFRNFGSYWIKQVYQIAFQAKPDGSSFRLMRRSLVQKLLLHTQPFVFLDGLIHWHTASIVYCPVEHRDRSQGRSTYTLSKLLALTMNLIFNFTVLPLRFVTYLGLITALLSFCFGFYFIINKLLHDVPLGYTSVIVSLFFSTGLILISLGIMGEYLSRIFMLQNHKPQYSVAEVKRSSPQAQSSS